MSIMGPIRSSVTTFVMTGLDSRSSTVGNVASFATSACVPASESGAGRGHPAALISL